MKQRLKLALFGALCAVATGSFAQISVSIKAGLNLAKVITDDDNAPEPKIIPSFQTGVVLEFGITETIAIQSGVFLQGKGYQTEDKILGQTIKSKADVLYLQIPAHILYKGNGFFVGVGPYAGVALSGKYRTEILGKKETRAIKIGDTNDHDVTPLDFGLGAQVGLNIGDMRIGAGYDLGLSNLVPKLSFSRDKLKISSSVINFFVAYLFVE